VEPKNAQKKLSQLQRMTCLGITGGMRSTIIRGYVNFATLTIKHATRQVANRLLGNVPNFGHLEVLIKITDEMRLLLAPRDKFVTLNIFGRKLSVDFPARENRSTKCADLVFFTGGSLCEGRAGAGVFSDILNVQGIICLRLSRYSLSIRSICYFGVLGILHFGGHCQRSSINLL
jgi:hypothetical protein